MVATLEHLPVIAGEQERQTFAMIEQMLARGGRATVLIEGSGGPVDLPDLAVRILRGVIHHLAQGHSITYFPLSSQFTTQEAAEVLNVSRPHVVKLLQQGEMPYTMVGTHRRIEVGDLLVYKQRRDSRRREKLAELTAMSEEFGLYDDPIRPEDLDSEG